MKGSDTHSGWDSKEPIGSTKKPEFGIPRSLCHEVAGKGTAYSWKRVECSCLLCREIGRVRVPGGRATLDEFELNFKED